MDFFIISNQYVSKNVYRVSDTPLNYVVIENNYYFLWTLVNRLCNY